MPKKSENIFKDIDQIKRQIFENDSGIESSEESELENDVEFMIKYNKLNKIKSSKKQEEVKEEKKPKQKKEYKNEEAKQKVLEALRRGREKGLASRKAHAESKKEFLNSLKDEPKKDKTEPKQEPPKPVEKVKSDPHPIEPPKQAEPVLSKQQIIKELLKAQKAKANYFNDYSY